jgi:hypothetical protein
MSREMPKGVLATKGRRAGDGDAAVLQHHLVRRPPAFRADHLKGNELTLEEDLPLWTFRRTTQDCHLRNGFRDFVFGRILSAGQPVASEIDPVSDQEWHTNVDLVLTPDETLTPSQRHGVEIDYGMKGGKVTITCRQAMLFYALRTLNFELNGLPRKGERQLVIANLADVRPLLPRPGQA